MSFRAILSNFRALFSPISKSQDVASTCASISTPSQDSPQTPQPVVVKPKSNTIFCAIVACDDDFGIGKDGSIPWYSSEDLAHFKETTMARTVVMGRKTWESLPESVRPLPGRNCIVLTRDTEYEAKGATVLHSVEEVIEATYYNRTVYVIGGSEIFDLFKDVITSFMITHIKGSFGCDTYLSLPAGTWTTCTMDSWEEEHGLQCMLEYGWRVNK